jgi:competence protein ComQ
LSVITTKILEALETIVKDEIQQENLKETIQKYIDAQTKKGFPFAELTILHYQMLNGTDLNKILPVAAAIELLVLSFDILDDIEDGDNNQKLWLSEQSIALNASTAMIFVCIDVIRKTDLKNKEKAISVLLEYSLLSIGGQHMDLLSCCRTEKEYIEMALKKSGSLVSLACLIGATLACDKYLEEIKRYSQFMGLIGQLNNDIYDLRSFEEKNDLLSKKLSLPIIYLFGCNEGGAEIISSYYNGFIQKDELLEKQKFVIDTIVKSGAIVYTEIIKRIYQNKVKTELQHLDIEKKFVEQLLKYVI